MVKTTIHWYLVFPILAARRPPTICPAMIPTPTSEETPPRYTMLPLLYKTVTCIGQMMAKA